LFQVDFEQYNHACENVLSKPDFECRTQTCICFPAMFSLTARYAWYRLRIDLSNSVLVTICNHVFNNDSSLVFDLNTVAKWLDDTNDSYF